MIIKDSRLKPHQTKALMEGDDAPDPGTAVILTEGEEKELALAFYGPKFEGFQDMLSVKHLVPCFRDFYLNKIIAQPGVGIKDVVCDFNARLAPGISFHPRINLLHEWAAVWKESADYMARVPDMAPSETYLDSGMRTLATELIADAHSTLREASNPGEAMTSRDRIALKRYVSDVLAKVTSLVHGKAKIMLAASSEKRENTSFLIETLQKASAGKLKLEDLEALKKNTV